MMRCKLFSVIMFLFLCSLSFSYELIVENRDTTHCVALGSWDTWTTGSLSGNKFVHTPGTGTDTVTYQTPITAGWYKIDVRINSNTNYTTAAHYQVTHRDGVDNLTITQRRGSSGWYVLGGAFYFDGTATVVLSDEFTSAEGSYIIADDIRFQSVFSFVQFSDTHAGYGPGNTQATQIATELQTPGRMQMSTYGFYAPPPSFGIHCGDITEFGKEYWSKQESIFSVLPFPLYRTLGNHDSTQNSNKEAVKALYGGSYYSFDYNYGGTRHHFICLDSTILQTPRAAFSREELDWLISDLAALPANTPVFVFFHHPLNGTLDPKPYDTNKFLDILKSRIGVIAFMGHGHNAVKQTVDQLTFIEGGSTYDDDIGVGCYNIITVVHNRVWVAKKVYGEATAASGLLSAQTIPTAPSYPTITVASPAKDAIETGANVSVTSSISGASGTVTACDVELDGSGTWLPMTGTGNGPYTGPISMSSLIHGRHYILVRFTMSTGGPFYKTIPFWHWDGYPKPKYIVDLGASSLSAPVIDNGKVYVGANGGSFRCVDAKYGYEIWKVILPSDVMSTAEVVDGKVIFGCGDGYVYCLNANTGADLWKKELSGPVYSSPRVSGTAVYIGCNGTGAASSAYLYSLDISNGNQNWRYPVGNAIESRPYVLGGVVFVGAWDTYLYAINTASGTLKWRYQRTTDRYVSPADAWPVASANSNKVYAADRGYQLNAIDITTGVGAWTRSGISAQNLNKDASALLIRNYAAPGDLDKIDFENTMKIWGSPCVLDSAAVAPMVCGEKIAIVEQNGMASILSDATGAIEYKFQIARGYELHPVNTDSSGNLYASTYDGYLLCVSNSAPAPETVPDIVLESRDSSGNLVSDPPYKEYVTGDTWADSAEKSAAVGLTGLGSRFNSFTGELTGKASASPNITTSGEYNVFVTWNKDSNANNVSYTINHKNGSATVALNQKPAGAAGGSNANTWINLGKYAFDAGQNEATGAVIVDESTVTGPNSSSYSTGKTYSDGYMFSYVPLFTPTATPTPTFTPTPSPSPTTTPMPTPGLPMSRIVFENFQSYTSDTNLRAVWTTSNSTLAFIKTSGGADGTTKWMELTDGGWGMNILATFANVVTTTGSYKPSFYYKNGHVNNVQGALVVTFKDGAGNTKSTFNLGPLLQTTWQYVEAPSFVTFNANDSVRVEITGTYSGTLAQACAFDQFNLAYDAPTPTPSPIPTASPSPIPTASPSPIPTASPEPTPSPEPTASPSPEPTASPEPTVSPSPVPSVTPIDSFVTDWKLMNK